jgi:hypothetical protein
MRRFKNQPIRNKKGILEFLENRIIRDLVDKGIINLNEVAKTYHEEKYNQDHQQLAQLIGYSLGGYLDLSYVGEDRRHAAGIIREYDNILENKKSSPFDE